MKSLSELADLTGRVALIAGGAGHIGRVLAETLLEMGCAVVLLDQRESDLAAVQSTLTNPARSPVHVIEADLAVEQQVRSAPARAADMAGRLDVVIHCAALVGTTQLKGWVVPFSEQSSEAWRLALEVNLTSFFELSQAAAPLLQQSGHGSIIAMGSIYGLVGPDMRLYEGTTMGNPAAYAASKGGLFQLVRYLSTVLAPRIRVNAITPGGVWRNQPEVFHERYRARTPLQRMASEEDFKGATAYLASDLSAYVTGQNLVVDGGWTAW